MGKIAYFSKEQQYSFQDITDDIQKFSEIKELLTYLIEIPDTPYILFETHNIYQDVKMLDAIHSLNRMLPIFLLGSAPEDELNKYAKEYETIKVCNSETSLEELAKEVEKNPRKSNRVNWPLTAKFFKDPERPQIGRGNITSLSIGGLFIRTNHTDEMKLNEKVYFDIAFMDFSFLVEGKIVALISKEQSGEEMDGFSVKFENISDHTRKYILDLINNKLLNMLINDL